ncbi:MAG: hypothetical protein ACUZ8E_17485 [Candidatus Anammoxibacter sp.]
MKIADVVNQLALVLPNFTDLFGDIQAITSITAASGLATVTTTAAHGLITGQAVSITGVETRTPIASFIKSGLNFTYTTLLEHDLTFGWIDNENIELRGFTDNDWNTSFALKASDNRFDFTVQSANADPVLNGNEFLLEPNRVDGVNGLFSITVTSLTTFTISGNFLDGTYTPVNGKIFSNPRIAATVNIDRALDEYTKQNTLDFWLFIEPVNVQVSKDRSEFSDATAAIPSGAEIRTRMIDGFTVYIVAPTSAEIAAEKALDICRHDLLLPLMKTLYGFKLDTGVSNVADFRITLESHGVSAYERAFLVYGYEFQFVIDLTEDDQFRASGTRAFRNIDFTQTVGGDDTEDSTITTVNLDKTP